MLEEESLFEPKKFLSIEYILSKITEEDIFLKYLGLYPKEKVGFTNPLRDDGDPDCYFYIDPRGRWKFNDIAAKWNVDCFNVVEYIESCNLKEALQIISNDFELEGADSPPRNRSYVNQLRANKAFTTSFQVQRRKWNLGVDKEYWTGYHLTSKILNHFNIAPVQHIWLIRSDTNIPKIVYKHNPKDPCYVYTFHDEQGQEVYKFYFPLREGKRRFMQGSNIRDVLQGWEQLPEFGEILIITKSLKDVACFFNYSIPSVAPTSETILISKAKYIELYNRFDQIYTLFDFDRAGVRLLREYETAYNIPYLLFPSSFKSPFQKKGIKDFADHNKERGIQETLDLIEYVKKEIIS